MEVRNTGDGRLGGRGPKGSCEAVWWQAVVMKLILDPFYTKTLPSAVIKIAEVENLLEVVEDPLDLERVATMSMLATFASGEVLVINFCVIFDLPVY